MTTETTTLANLAAAYGLTLTDEDPPLTIDEVAARFAAVDASEEDIETARRLAHPATLAGVISARYHDDGRRWRDDDHVHIEDALLAAGARKDRSDDLDATRWTLSDGSVIVTSWDGWDLGYPGTDCWCWQGAGHEDGCAEVAS